MSLRRAVIALVLLTGCGGEPPPLDPACLDSTDAYLRAVDGLPGEVRLPGGPPLSQCVTRARSDGELQQAGVLIVGAADRLARRAQDGDERAALQLGYLAGAVEKGASRTQGVQAELARRVLRAGAVLGDPPPAIEAAFLRGLEDGRRAP